MNLTCILMVSHSDLPFDLKELAWAESTGLCTVAPFSWWGDQLAVWWCKIHYATSSGIPNLSQNHQSTLQRGWYLLLTMEWWMSSTQHSCQVLYVTHTFAGYDRSVQETQEGKTLCWECWCSLCSWIPADSDTNGLPKGKPAFKVGCPVMLCATYILPKSSAMTTDHFHLHTHPWGLQFGKWTWWTDSVHSLLHFKLT